MDYFKSERIELQKELDTYKKMFNDHSSLVKVLKLCKAYQTLTEEEKNNPSTIEFK